MNKPTLPDISNIPPFNIPDEPLVSTTQAALPVADITHNLILFKDGGVSLVLESTSLNFGLLSEQEQEAVVYSYAALINSLSFQVQILVRTQRKDITNYLRYLDNANHDITNPKLKALMGSYRKFIGETIKKRNVLGKRFFLIIPFSKYELGFAKSNLPFQKQTGPLPYSKSYIIKKARTALHPKRDHLIRQASRLGLRLRQLTNEEIVRLIYDVYNPDIETVRVKKEEDDENTNL